MVTDSRAASSDGAVRPVDAPAPVKVREGSNGKPQAVRIGRRWHKAVSITNRWHLGPDEWWTEHQLDRLYFTLRLEEGRPFTVFQDLLTSQWYSQRA
ncbi:MAG: hypothetical protein EXR47_06005 [Dehalococcoidia bacterium]|nr:hypothetical protein [Dehalococcoidia bacterium]